MTTDKKKFTCWLRGHDTKFLKSKCFTCLTVRIIKDVLGCGSSAPKAEELNK